MTELLVLVLLAGLAGGMSTIAAIAVKWAVSATGPLSASVVQFVLAMMAAMFLGVVVYFAIGGGGGVAAGLWVASGVMSASVMVVFVGFWREVRARAPGAVPGSGGVHRGLFVASVIGLVLANEFLMGWSFSLVTHALPVGFGTGDRQALVVAIGAIVSPWFVFPMAFEMIVTLGFLVSRFPPVMRRLLVLQPAIMICSPPTISGLPWLLGSSLGASGLMAGAVAVLLIALFRGEAISSATVRYLLALFVSLGLMAGGLYVWVELSSAGLFAVSLLAQMAAFLWAATAPERFGAASTEPARRPRSAEDGPAAEGT